MEFPICAASPPCTTLGAMAFLKNFEQTLPRLTVPAGSLPRAFGLATLAARAVLGGLFLWAGALKLSNPRAFAHVVDEYDIVPDGWPLVIAALAIPTLELLAGIGALLDRRGGHLLMLGMLALFIGVLWFGILNDLDVDCGCFSLEERRGRASLQAAFVRDCVMAAVAAWCLFANHRKRTAHRELTTTNRESRP